MRRLRKGWRGPAFGGLTLVMLAFPATATADTGQLTFLDCVAGNTAITACGQLPNASASGNDSGLDAPHGMTVSPDGRNLYVVASNDAAVTTFARDAGSGALTRQGCITSESAVPGCTETPDADSNGTDTGLYGPRDVAITADGAFAYVPSEFGDAVATFRRDQTTGALTYLGCISSNTDVTGCTQITGAAAGGTNTPLNGLRGFALSADGLSVYTAATASSALATFSRDPTTGALAYVGCVSSDPNVTGCAQLPGSRLQGLYQVAVASDGGDVYTSSTNSASVAGFDRASNGTLSFRECFTSALNVPACTPLPGATPDGDDSQLDDAYSLTTSADGTSVYAAAEYPAAVTHFARDPASGALTHRGCLTSNTDIVACVPIPGATPNSDGTSLRNPEDVIVSADGNNVYVSSYDASLVRFNRDPVSGALAYADCLTSSTTVNGCSQIPGATVDGNDSPFESLWPLAISPDGRNLYAAGEGSAAISRLSRELPPNSFTFGKVKKNKRKGTAKLHVIVQAHGSLALAGRGLRSRTADAPTAGDYVLKVKTKGKKAKRLRKRGKVKVKAQVTFSPVGNDPTSQSKRIKLIRKSRR